MNETAKIVNTHLNLSDLIEYLFGDASVTGNHYEFVSAMYTPAGVVVAYVETYTLTLSGGGSSTSHRVAGFDLAGRCKFNMIL
jgi:hypothetical protein